MIIIYFLLSILSVLLSELALKKGNYTLRDLLTWDFVKKILLSLAFVYLATTITFMSFVAIINRSTAAIAVMAVAALFFALLRLIINFTKKRETLALVLLALTVALFLEGFVFNMRHYKTIDYKPFSLKENAKIINAEYIGENEYKPTSSSFTIEITDINQKVNNIHLGIIPKDKDGLPTTANVTVYMTDKSNALYKSLPTRTISGDIESTKYLHLITNGDSEKLKFTISTSAKSFVLGDIYANAKVEFNFSILRFLITAFVIFILALLRPASSVYKHKLSFSSKQTLAIAIILVAEIVVLLIISTLNPAFYGHPGPHTRQYQQLADAFLDGKLYLAEEVPEFLKNMNNPYDYALRTQAAAEAGETYYWDAAYFDGHYYVYFGVLPVLLFYLPFKALTGIDLPNLAVIEILLAAFAVAALYFVISVIKKYFKPEKIPFASFVSLYLILVNASGAVFIAKRPDFYSIPIISALTLTMLGLSLWIRSTANEDKINKAKIALGSLCMALVAACRPQFLLVSVLAFVIFWDSVFKSRTLISKKGFSATVAFCIPYLAVAAGLMWYNFARFGSPFDFGQNYNLTTNDMTGRGIVFERTGLAIFTYFFQAPKMSAAFPFIQKVDITTSYLGTTISEAMFGGIFATIPLLWLIFLIPMARNNLKEKRLLPFVTITTILSFVIGIVDAQGAGLLARYVSDFSYLAIIAAILIFLTLYEKQNDVFQKYLNGFLTFSLFSSGIYCALMVFAVYGTEIFYKNPSLYWRVATLVEFWK